MEVRSTMTNALLRLDTDELREWLCDEFRLCDVPPELWRGLSQDGHAKRVANATTKHAKAACLEYARQYLEAHSDERRMYSVKSDRPLRAQQSRVLSERANARNDYFHSHVKSAARDDRGLIAFRQNVLQGELLSPRRAATVLTSDATRFLHAEFFQSNHIPIVGHSTRLCLADGTPARSWDTNVFLRIEWNGQSHDVPYKREWFFDVPRSSDAISVPSQTGGSYPETVAWGSVLHDLREISLRLARMCSWKEHHAVWFVLTDTLLSAVPAQVWISAGRTAGFTFGKITLELDAWLSAEDVYGIYQDVQRGSFKERNPLWDPEHIRLHEFVTNLDDNSSHPLSWTDRMRRWNQSPEGQSGTQYTDRRLFKKDFTRTADWIEREMVSPEYMCLRRPTSQPRRRSTRSSQ